jgi:ankyrin repeat protein
MADESRIDPRPRNRALVAAVQSGDVEAFAGLIALDQTSLRMMTPWGTWLHVAAEAGQVRMVDYLLAQGLDVNTRGGTFKGNALHIAASSGHVEVVRKLLALGAYVDTSEPERNPLFGAVYGGHVHVVELLLDSGIDATIKYSGRFMKNMSVVEFARERGQLEIAALIDSRSRNRLQ